MKKDTLALILAVVGTLLFFFNLIFPNTLGDGKYLDKLVYLGFIICLISFVLSCFNLRDKSLKKTYSIVSIILTLLIFFFFLIVINTILAPV
ncbi:hypothetical protein FJZ22_02825 [Candidatus Pacearchaeota archaeon]|nr:hypothetical protein [Candidatus Pacearchaeota archaeon]